MFHTLYEEQKKNVAGSPEHEPKSRFATVKIDRMFNKETNPKFYGEYLVKLKYKGFNPFDISDYRILTYYPSLGWQGVPSNMVFDGWTWRTH